MGESKKVKRRSSLDKTTTKAATSSSRKDKQHDDAVDGTGTATSTSSTRRSRMSRRASTGGGGSGMHDATTANNHGSGGGNKTRSSTSDSPRRSVNRRNSLGPTATAGTTTTTASPGDDDGNHNNKTGNNKSRGGGSGGVSNKVKDKSKLMGTRSPKKNKAKLTSSLLDATTTTTTTRTSHAERLQTLQEAFLGIRPFVESGSSKASRALRRLEKAIEAMADIPTTTTENNNTPPKYSLTARYTLMVDDPTPSPASMDDDDVFLSRATYAANDPSEDRSTVVIGDGFIFAGVWDGHGGTATAAEFTAQRVFSNFCKHYHNNDDDGVGPALAAALVQTDRDYLEHAKRVNRPTVFFAGTCAVCVFIDTATRHITCANLGDSRAVMGVYNNNGGGCSTTCVPLSIDHAADDPTEQARLRAEHPHDREIVMNLDDAGEDPDWRVKGMAAFTRSIGDLHLKDKNAAALFNSYVSAPQRIQPRPGVKLKKTGLRKPKYISNEPELKETTLENSGTGGGFVILACDGVWDEMTSQEAVRIVHWLLTQYDPEEQNIAELFIEETLKHAVRRIAATYEEEANLTLDQLKKRPPGKETDAHRSMLHDDITVVIVHLGPYPTQSGSLFRMLQKDSHNNKHPPSDVTLDFETQSVASYNRTKHKRELAVRSAGLDISRHVDALLDDAERQFVDKQILQMMRAFDEMGTRSLSILFHAVDVDDNGTLDRNEVTRLVRHVIQMDVSPAVIDLAFSEMDADGSGDVDLDEFIQFFGGGEE